MRLRFPLALIVTLLTAFLSVYSIFASHHEGVTTNQPQQQTSSPSQPDPISGVWDVSFFVNDKAHPSTFDLKLEGAKVTGTAFSDHTGPGTVRDGSWSEGKLSFTLDFKKHESIVVKGTLKDGKLAGEFTTEGFTSNWEAKRK